MTGRIADWCGYTCDWILLLRPTRATGFSVGGRVEREREHCLLQLDELDSNYDKNTQLYIIMYDKVNIKINIHIISH